MSIRERGNVWPVISVAAGAFFVLVVMPFILHRQKSGQMATVDAQVTTALPVIGEPSGDVDEETAVMNKLRQTADLLSGAGLSVTPVCARGNPRKTTG